MFREEGERKGKLRGRRVRSCHLTVKYFPYRWAGFKADLHESVETSPRRSVLSHTRSPVAVCQSCFGDPDRSPRTRLLVPRVLVQKIESRL